MKTTAKLIVAAMLASTSMPALALEEGKLTIWTGANRDHDALKTVLAKFTADTGIEVKLELVDPDLPAKYQQAASTGDGPDIVLWAHDRFGEWAAAGLIQPLNVSAEVAGGILPTAMDAVSQGGKVWGYPVAVEAIGLIYNKKLVATPPANFEDIAGLTVEGNAAKIMWDYNNTYFTMPMLMANGGFAFQKVDGAYDGKVTGVNNDGAKAGAAVLKKLIDDGVMPKGVDYGVMDGAMNKGEVAMVINGPWSWANFKASGIDFAVAPIPAINGKPSPAFLGVQALALNAATKNADLAVELIENYILTDDGLNAWNANGGLGALADVSAGASQNDANIQATLANAAIAVPMPSNPEMGAFWSAMGPALTNITTGASTVDAALDDAAKRILGGQ
jgi:maltose/maltodextrin transport system substrate-binding protein